MNELWAKASSCRSLLRGTPLSGVVGIALSGCVADLLTRPDPLMLDPITFEAISAGGAFTCGLSDGRAWCWGDNTTGQLGDGTKETRLIATAVAGNTTFTAITTGSMHACALDTTGEAYCWGSHHVGQLGLSAVSTTCAVQDFFTIPDLPCVTTPQPVPGGLSFKDIDAGPWLTCGVTTQDHTYCWGLTAQFASDPAAAVFGLRFVDSTLALQAVTTGSTNACGIDASGAGYCWGDFDLGLGIDMSTSAPPECMNPGGEWTCSPVLIDGGHAFREVEAGFSHMCGVTTTGDVYCWGQEIHQGTLGPFAGSSDRPLLMDFVPTDPTALSASGFTCILNPTALVSCWGTGSDNGELTPVPGEVAFASISVGEGHACGIAPTGDGYCWGNNEWGALGIGSRGSRIEPARVGAAR